MTSYDTAVSNGTCYWKAGAKAGRSFIPCGNAYAPDVNFQCCNVGDICFDNGACFNDAYGATYFAACTDPNYGAPECPNKGKYSSQQWNGLVTCGTSTGQFNKDETWAGCPEPNLDHLTSFTKGCECNDTNPPLFTDYADLVRTAQLPKSSGGSIQFINGHEASTIVVTVVSTLAFGSLTTEASTSFASQTSTTAAGASSTSTSVDVGSGFATGTKVGIGAGIAGGAILVGIIAILAWFLRRRDKRNEKGPMHEPEPSPQPNSTLYNASFSSPIVDSHDNTPGFTGYKAELAADGPPSGGTLVSPMSLASPQFQSQQQQYEAYNPDRHGNYSEYSHRSNRLSPQRETICGSVLSISPQLTGSTQDHVVSGNERVGPQSMAPIAELQG